MSGKKVEKISFFNLTKKYWKEQLFFYFLCTLSCLGSQLISDNGIKIFLKREKNSDYLISFLNKELFNFRNDKKKYFYSIFIIIFFYFLIVFFHVLFSFYFQNKLRYYLKKKLSFKIFKIGLFVDKKKINSLLTYNIKNLSDSIFYIPNQIYYVVVSSILNIISIKNSGNSNLMKLSFFYFLFLLIICVFSQYYFYKEELRFQDYLENELKEELFF